MKSQFVQSKRWKYQLAALVGASALVLSGCSSAANSGGGSAGGSGSGQSVAAGASIEEWQAALADIDPIEIVYQASSPSSAGTAHLLEAWADKVEEYSNGNVTVEIVWNYAIAGIVESDDALRDGRIDLHIYSPFSNPTAYPVNGTLVLDSLLPRDSSLISGTLTLLGAGNQAAFMTPGIVEELTDKGLFTNAPVGAAGLNALACSTPVTSLADFRGKLIRYGSQTQSGQIEALGGTPVYVPYPEMYEALQRGIIDCTIFGPTGIIEADIISIAPYLITPKGAAFATNTGPEVAGVNWANWPLPVQQLIFDTMHEYIIKVGKYQADQMVKYHSKVAEAGGEFLELDDEASKLLADHNRSVVDDMGTRTDVLSNAQEYATNALAQFEEWRQLVEELGYSDAPIGDYDNPSMADIDMEPFFELYLERVVSPNRPS